MPTMPTLEARPTSEMLEAVANGSMYADVSITRTHQLESIPHGASCPSSTQMVAVYCTQAPKAITVRAASTTPTAPGPTVRVHSSAYVLEPVWADARPSI